MNWIVPMEPMSIPQVKEGPFYIHEIKWDGIRGMVYLQQHDMHIFTKKGNDRTGFYPELHILKEALGDREAVLDGEMVVNDKNGLPAFHNALVRETVKNKRNLEYYLKNYPVSYMVFDILFLRGKILTGLPLKERKQILEELMAPVARQIGNVFLSEVFDDGRSLYESMKLKNMEGIVSKNIESLYIGGKKHGEWFKTKFTKKMLCVVGGIQWKQENPNSLILGVKNEEGPELIFMGKASLGLKGSDISLLKEYGKELMQKECPFGKESISELDMTGTGITWTVPALTCWISFLELSNDGHFRHPKIAGFTRFPAEEADGKVLTE